MHICTPNASHGPLTRLALAAGKHVVCEKPLSVDAPDATELAALAEASGLVTAVPFVYRYHPMAAEARHRVRSGSIGDVRLIHGHYLQDWLLPARRRQLAGGPGGRRRLACVRGHRLALVRPGRVGERPPDHRARQFDAVARRAAVPERSDRRRRSDAPRSPPRTRCRCCSARRPRRGRQRGGLPGLARAQEPAVVRDRRRRAAASRSIRRTPRRSSLGGRARTEIVLIRDPRAQPEAARLSPVPAGHPLGYRDCFAAFVADVYDAVRAPRGQSPAEPPYPTFADAAAYRPDHRRGRCAPPPAATWMEVP